MSSYFEIKKLECSYEHKKVNPKVVLEIDELTIPKGEVVFIVGHSGCGKSTILETLGLMNNTILKAESFKINLGNGVDGQKIWNEGNMKLSEIRKKYFSFIFQETNLMRNFTIQENAEIPQQIKGGDKKYVDILKKVFPEKESANENETKEWKEIKSKTDVRNLSGGQRQRIAFVRAFLPNFNILFGDEPTGNLDPENADNLMKIVMEEIHNSDEKSAIIVSHSPELSVKYADRIIKIQIKEREVMKDEKKVKEIFGKIDHSSIYEKRNNQWFYGDKQISDNDLQKIIQK